MGRFLKASPLLTVVAIATLVVFALSAISYARRGGFWSRGVQAEVSDQFRNKNSSSGAANSKRVFPLQGEVYSDAERLREASAVAMATFLLAATEKLNGRSFSTVEALLGRMVSDGNVPPGVSFDQAAKAFVSREGIYYVRYRREPLGVEVLSVCKGALCGPGLLMRLPDDGFSQGSLTYYQAPGVGKGVEAPAAFASTADVIRTGWRPVTFKAPVVESGK